MKWADGEVKKPKGKRTSVPVSNTKDKISSEIFVYYINARCMWLLIVEISIAYKTNIV